MACELCGARIPGAQRPTSDLAHVVCKPCLGKAKSAEAAHEAGLHTPPRLVTSPIPRTCGCDVRPCSHDRSRRP